MREIKFRVWSGKMWLDAHDAYIHVRDGDAMEIELIAGAPHKDYVMCQCTGLTDKNGKEIYTGDIVRYIDRNYLVEIPDIYESLAGAPGWADSPNELEIVGNIYENPELLNQGR